MTFLKTSVAAAALAVAFAAAPASAAPISPNQSFDVNGSLQVSGTPFDQATGLDFGTGTAAPIVFGTPGGTATIGGSTSSEYVAQGFNAGGMGSTIDIASGNLTLGIKNITNFYSFMQGGNTLRFDLGAITSIDRLPGATGGRSPSIIVGGTGTVTLTGFDATTAIFSLTTTNTGGGSDATFAASVNTGATPQMVPEPASMALLGMGLAGLGLVRRRRKA